MCSVFRIPVPDGARIVVVTEPRGSMEISAVKMSQITSVGLVAARSSIVRVAI